jgi:hypothetical protein
MLVARGTLFIAAILIAANSFAHAADPVTLRVAGIPAK